jgi:hypothetical protein
LIAARMSMSPPREAYLKRRYLARRIDPGE